MFGFGPIEVLLDNPQITEVMVNGTINNRKYAEMYQITWNKYRAILDNDILKIKEN